MEIPLHDTLPVNAMSRIFKSTTATYKFYWFIGILDLFVKWNKTRFSAWEVVIQIVANAWYPVCYFHLSFGKLESLYKAIVNIQKECGIPLNISPNELSDWLRKHIKDAFIVSELKVLLYNVPYRFLSPWIKTSDDDEMVRRSQKLENDCLYKIIDEETGMRIELNEKWYGYLRENYAILRDFAYWNLARFLQVRNPNVPNIPNKLIKPESRGSLSQQRRYWDFVISHERGMCCIYTGKPIVAGEYDLDHFIPWSFVSHDLVWNLLPADGSINSSKSNKLPSLDKYLSKMALMQQRAVRDAVRYGFNSKVLEDYLSLGCTIQEISEMDEEHLYDCFSRTYSPLSQIAQNMGFERWAY